MRFLLIRSIVALTPGKTIHAQQRFDSCEQFFSDHFPGFPVVPGVLLTEVMAQAAGKCLYADDPQRGRPILAQIRDATFRSWVKPDETLDVYVDILAGSSAFARAQCRLEVNGSAAARAELLFSYVANETFAHDYEDQVLVEYLSRSDRDSTLTPGD